MTALEVQRWNEERSNNGTHYIKISKPSDKSGVVQCLLGLLMHCNYRTWKIKAFLSGLGTNAYEARNGTSAFGPNSLPFQKVKHGWDKGTSICFPQHITHLTSLHENCQYFLRLWNMLPPSQCPRKKGDISLGIKQHKTLCTAVRAGWGRMWCLQGILLIWSLTKQKNEKRQICNF